MRERERKEEGGGEVERERGRLRERERWCVHACAHVCGVCMHVRMCACMQLQGKAAVARWKSKLTMPTLYMPVIRLTEKDKATAALPRGSQQRLLQWQHQHHNQKKRKTFFFGAQHLPD